MVATLGGVLALLVGLAILLLPLLATELSRPRDSAWGALMLLLGLVLVSSRDRLSGAPMLGVLAGGLLIGRLMLEVGQGRWRQLTGDEQSRLGSKERWNSSLQQVGAAAAALGRGIGQTTSVLNSWIGNWIGSRQQSKTTTKRWVRPDHPAPTPVVRSLEEVDNLIQQSTDSPSRETTEPERQAG